MNDTDDVEVIHTFSRKRSSKPILLPSPSKERTFARKSDTSKSRKRSKSVELDSMKDVQQTEPEKKKARKSNHCETPTAKSLDALEAQRAFFAAIDSQVWHSNIVNFFAQPLEDDSQQQDDEKQFLHTDLTANKDDLALINKESQHVNRSDLLQQMYPTLYSEYKQYCDVVASFLVPMSFEEFLQERMEMPESNSQPTVQDHFV